MVDDNIGFVYRKKLWRVRRGYLLTRLPPHRLVSNFIWQISAGQPPVLHTCHSIFSPPASTSPRLSASIKSMDYDTKYTVSLRGSDFTLTRSQIEFDGPNYFTACFLGNFRESQTHRVELNRDPDLFRIIASYLCGYLVLPLSDRVIPSTMSPSAALLNLRADALFYQLDELIEACDKLIEQNRVRNSVSNRYLILGIKRHFRESEYGLDDSDMICTLNHHLVFLCDLTDRILFGQR